MDGRTSRLLLLGLVLASSGCVTTQEKKVTVADQVDAPSMAAASRDEAKKPAPPRILLAFAEMKERDADAAKDNPEGQARLRDDARRAYQELLKADPDHLEGYRGLARVYGRLGDYGRAHETCMNGVAKHPRDVTLWHDLGTMHGRRKDWDESAKCFRKALEIDPENQRCLKALGFTLARAGQIDESVSFLARAMGSAATAHFNVAMMLLHLGEQEQGEQRAGRTVLARQHLQIALRENPNYERAREVLESLEAQTVTPTRGTVEIQFADPGQ